MYNKVNPKQSFPKLEEEVLEFWNKEKIFEESMDRPDAEEFNFYDGPPFATGTPHYGHILAGTIKDVIPRYQTMLGKKVSRKFGWDTHGLPIENIVEKKMGISGKDDIEKVGVHAFNEECRANVFGYVDEWEKTVNRMGRWVDMTNDYKTMDTDFMESVWWVFKSVHDKGLIYEGNRVVPYCPRCTTPLSNFEVNQGYKDKQDKTVTVKFKVIQDENSPLIGGDAGKAEGVYVLAWTTTPWTLPANLGLAVGSEIIYSEILDKQTGETYIIASDLLGNYYKQPKKAELRPVSETDDYKIIKEYKGECLAGLKYEALFDDAKTQLTDMGADLGTGVEMGENSYSIVIGHHVTTESGTGIVHIAPAYGEDDNIIGKEQKLGFFSHIGDTGKTYNLLENNYVEIADFNEIVLKDMKDRNLAVLINTINHSYPHCWRCDTPLIYRAISAWYVNVEKIRDQMVANNLKTNWTPENIKEGRFGKWLEGARDWNISRNRYWGSAMPVWQSEDKKSEVVIGSIEELYQANKEYGQIRKEGDKYINVSTGEELDIHKHFVDEIFVKDNKNTAAKNVFGIHGFTGNVETGDFWKSMKSNLLQNGITLNAPQFEEKRDTTYSEWESKLNDSNISECDTVIAHSMGCRIAMEYIIQNNIKLERLVLVAPAISGSKRKEILALYSELKHDYKEITKFVKEIIIVHSIDDDVVPVVEGKQIAKELNADFIQVNGYKHISVKECNLLEGIVKCGTPLKRIPEVLDCWFESGSMPYASKHYMGEENSPLLGKEGQGVVPADFIAEGLDQTRGWFYTLIILSTALFDSPATMNTIVNGIILAEDGKKMSKSLNNYPAPELIFDKYGADAMRFYLMNSPVVEGQDMRFTEQGVEEVVKKVILPLWNTYSFFVTYANIDGFETNTPLLSKEGSGVVSNPLDKWILSETHKLINDVTTGLDDYRISEATRNIPAFMDNLTNWYIRRSRKRFWKSENDGDKVEAYQTLHEVLVTVSKLIAPFMPFVAENMYQNLTGEKSVHLTMFPKADNTLIDNNLSADMDKTKKIINLGLAWRVSHKLKVRQPLKSVTIGENLSDYYKNILMEELNVKEVIEVQGTSLAKKVCKPNGRAIGPKFGKNVKDIMSAAKSGNFEELDNGDVKIIIPREDSRDVSAKHLNNDFILEAGDFELVFEAGDSSYEIEAGFGMVIALDPELTPKLIQEGQARDLVRAIQDARKEAEFNVEDRIEISITHLPLSKEVPEGGGISEVLNTFGKYIETETLSTISDVIEDSNFEKEVEIGEEKIILQLKK